MTTSVEKDGGDDPVTHDRLDDLRRRRGSLRFFKKRKQDFFCVVGFTGSAADSDRVSKHCHSDIVPLHLGKSTYDLFPYKLNGISFSQEVLYSYCSISRAFALLINPRCWRFSVLPYDSGIGPSDQGSNSNHCRRKNPDFFGDYSVILHLDLVK
ncbi:hypothetical protein F2Q68_00041075 [Brassica cretica]|uniref:Uncharacterized protein n=1 Tax=Brassica cretica TaxID=69181 RepID=A0A8S9MP93_BRACR|nr:hypothetical protein F2Q68_00041075 [Brassica cretica]